MTTPRPEVAALAEALAMAESQAPDDASEDEREEWRSKADDLLYHLGRIAPGWTLAPAASAVDRLRLATAADWIDPEDIDRIADKYDSLPPMAALSAEGGDQMSEPMIPKSMHDSAVEAAQVFERQRMEREAMQLIARIVEAAGGEVRLTRRAMVDDPPKITMTEAEDPLSGTRTYRTSEGGQDE